MSRTELRVRLDAEVAPLVERAAHEHWPVRADHCFLRIAYDNAVGAKWDTLVAKPAWSNLTLKALEAAIATLVRIGAEGRPALDELNSRSLGWRGKLRDPSPANR